MLRILSNRADFFRRLAVGDFLRAFAYFCGANCRKVRIALRITNVGRRRLVTLLSGGSSNYDREKPSELTALNALLASVH